MIKIRNLYKSFGSKKVLEGVSLDIEDGSTTCIIGKSGTGKSVLLKHIVGLLEPDAGHVEVDGKLVSSLNKKQLFELRNQIGFVFQGAALFDSYTVFENTILTLYEHGEKDINKLESEAKRVLSAVKLLPEDLNSSEFDKEWGILKDKKPSDLSGGMRKRVGVARALVGSPKYIFYDEPTTGLDPVTSEQIDDLIAYLAEKLKVTSLVITHDMFSVYRIADNIAMLHEGKLHFTGTVEEMKKSDNPEVIEFIDRYIRS